MPEKRVALTRRGLPADTMVEASTRRTDWVAMAADDDRASLQIARVLTYDPDTDTIVGHIAPWYTEGDPFVEILRAYLWISYDNGQSWERVGWLATGPEIVRHKPLDPDATGRVITHTHAHWGVNPQVGVRPRLLRFSMDVRRDIDTEVEIESFENATGRQPVDVSPV